MLPWVPRGALGQRRGLSRTAVRPKPRFPVWRGRELCGGYPLEISSRRFCQAIPVVPPRPVSAAATEYRSTECPARTLVKSASEPHRSYDRTLPILFWLIGCSIGQIWCWQAMAQGSGRAGRNSERASTGVGLIQWKENNPLEGTNVC